MGAALLVTGGPGVGKTTVMRMLMARWAARAVGLLTEEIRDGDRRVGFRVSPLDGATAVLAH